MNINFMNFANSIITQQNKISEILEGDWSDVNDLRDAIERVTDSSSWYTVDVGFKIIAEKLKRLCELANKTEDAELIEILKQLGCEATEDEEVV